MVRSPISTFDEPDPEHFGRATTPEGGNVARRSLWRNRVFTRIWAAHSISQVGTAVTQFALPLLAAQTLGATNTQVGLLLAVETIPLLALGLFVGVWADRRPRLPLMILADLARMLLVAVIPAAWWLGELSLGLLFAVVMLIGVFSVLFDVASQALVNSILAREHMIEGNARMQTSYAMADIAGPAGAGLLLRIVSTPVAFAIDAVSFGLSALALIGTKATERSVVAAPTVGDPARSPLRSILVDVRVGLAFVIDSPTLRTLTIGVATWNLFTAISRGMFILFLLEELGLSEITIGLVTAAGGVGILIGTLLPNVVTNHLGLGRGIVVALATTVPGYLLVAAAAGPVWLTIGCLLVGYVAQQLASSVADINQFSLRNAVTPDRLRGRVASAARVVLRGTVPVGFLIGGIVADLAGLRAAMLLGVIGPLLFAALIARSPIKSLRSLPPDPDEPHSSSAPIPFSSG